MDNMMDKIKPKIESQYKSTMQAQQMKKGLDRLSGGHGHKVMSE